MIRRLVEAHYDLNGGAATEAMVQFWLRECRTSAMLAELLLRFPGSVAAAFERRWLHAVDVQDLTQIEFLLKAEEDAQRPADREYWQPLKDVEQHPLNWPGGNRSHGSACGSLI